MARPLREQVVVITGASSGIGRLAALRFAERGARVVLASRNRVGLETVAGDIRSRGGQAIAVQADVTRPGQVEALAAHAVEAFGRIDTWISGAAVSHYARFLETPLLEMRQQFEVVYWGNVHCLKAAIPRMRDQGGTFIAIGSILSDFSVPLQSTYSAAKHALKGLLEAVRMELRHDGIPVTLTLIKPASVDTPFFRHALSRLGVVPKPIAPVYDPDVVVDELLRAACKPLREVAIGGAAKVFSRLHELAPTVQERVLAGRAFEQQRTSVPVEEAPPSNFFGPVYEPGEIRDTGDGWRASWVMWLERNPGAAAAGAVLGGLALAAAQRAARRR